MFSIKVKIINENNYPFNIELDGINIKINNCYYTVIPHLGLNVEKIKINDTEYCDFKYSHWSEIIIVDRNKDEINDQYVFNICQH